MKGIFRYIKPSLPIMSVQMFIKFLGTVTELLLPWMLSVILDEVAPTGDLSRVYLWGALMVGCALLAWLGNVVANRMSTAISRDITRKIRYDLFARISYLSGRQRDLFTTPSLISRLTSDTYNTHQMIDRMQRLGVRAPILLLGGIAVTLQLDLVLTLILISTLPILGFIIWYVSRKGILLYAITQRSLDRFVRKVQENMSGARVIKALSKGEYEKERFDEVNREVIANEQRAGMLMATTGPIMNLLLNAGLTLVIIVGAYRVQANLTQPGAIIAFLSYFTIILNALMMVSRLFTLLSRGTASARRISEVLEAPMELTAGAPERENSPHHVEFRQVSFSYNKVRENVSEIDFALKRGETLGIIGPTGSGKSTVMQLLLRFYDPDAGEIRIGGEKLTGIDPKVLHGMFGVVFQNDFLIADTIRENVRFGRELDEAAIVRALKVAQADFVSEKEGGLDAELVAKGENLSGGQRQRLLIARALAGAPEILLLDDCSSALDYKTDAALRRALKRDFSDTTTIIIAQRVSSIMNADKIMVLEEGRMIGYGTHRELLEQCESYREIASIQMGEVA